MNEHFFTPQWLSASLLQNIKNQGFERPTEIQEKTFSTVREGKDILALAETGSGKTGAFLIPLLERILAGNPDDEGFYLVLAPTRELAQQTYDFSQALTKGLNIETLKIIGGERFLEQRKGLEEEYGFIIGTPGRILDLAQKKSLPLKKCKGVILDEFDRLLDMGFFADIEKIFRDIPPSRQVVLFSATSHPDISRCLSRLRVEPEVVDLNKDQIFVDTIEQKLVHLAQGEKPAYLFGLIEERINKDKTCLVFCNTQVQTHVLAEWLTEHGYRARAISGNLTQAKRNKLITDVKNNEVDVLVATDVAARGLDINTVDLVINYDLPFDANQYVHRIGRTGRAGKSGEAYNLCAFEDCHYLAQIENTLKVKIPVIEVDEALLKKDLGKPPRVNMNASPDHDHKRSSNMRPQSNHRDGRGRPERNPRGRGRDDRAPQSASQGNSNVEVDGNRKDYRSASDHGRPRRSRDQRSGGRPQVAERTPRPRFEIKTVTIESSDFEKAREQAAEELGIANAKSISFNIVEEKKASFFGFGPKKVIYEFSNVPDSSHLLKKYIGELETILPFDVSFSLVKRERSYQIEIQGNDEALFVENEGELLEALDHLVTLYFNKQNPLATREEVYLSCGVLNTSKESKLQDLARRMRDKVLHQKAPVTLAPMGPGERRIIHQFFSEDSEVSTKSLGRDRIKRIVLELKA